jgi:hypothetical protein
MDSLSHRAIKLATLAPSRVSAPAATGKGAAKAAGRASKRAKAKPAIIITGIAVRPRLDQPARRRADGGVLPPSPINESGYVALPQPGVTNALAPIAARQRAMTFARRMPGAVPAWWQS